MIGLNSVEVAEAVAAGELEAGLVVLPIDAESLEVTPLRRDDVLFASADPARTSAPSPSRTSRRPTSSSTTPLRLARPHPATARGTGAARRGVLVPRIEVEHIDSALDLVARGAGDTIVSGPSQRAAPSRPAAHHHLRRPLYDTIALIQRSGVPLSPATRSSPDCAADAVGRVTARAVRARPHGGELGCDVQVVVVSADVTAMPGTV